MTISPTQITVFSQRSGTSFPQNDRTSVQADSGTVVQRFKDGLDMFEQRREHADWLGNRKLEKHLG